MDAGRFPTVECVTIDAVDPERLARFWAELLGLTVSHRVGPYVFLSSGGGLPGLAFQRADEEKSTRNRVHLDLAADELGVTARRIIELGGSRATGYADGGFLVMADPEGNELCLLPTGDWDIDERGVADYPHPDI